MLDLSPQDYAIWQQRQHRILMAETWNEIRLRERLARDEIAHFMQALECDGCGWPVVECHCDELRDIVARTIGDTRRE